MKQELQTQKKETAKIQLRELLGAGLLFVILGVSLAFGIDIMVDIRDDFTAGSDERHAVQNATDAVGEITEKLPTLATVVVASAIISVLLTFLFARFANVR